MKKWLEKNEKYLKRMIKNNRWEEKKFLTKIMQAMPHLKIKSGHGMFFVCINSGASVYEDAAVGFYIDASSVSFMGKTMEIDKKQWQKLVEYAVLTINSPYKPLIRWRRLLWVLKFKLGKG